MCRGYKAEWSGWDDRLCPAECCSEVCGAQGAQCDAVASRWHEDRHLLGRMFEAQSGGTAYQGSVAAAAHAARRLVSHKLGVAASLAPVPRPVPPLGRPCHALSFSSRCLIGDARQCVRRNSGALGNTRRTSLRRYSTLLGRATRRQLPHTSTFWTLSTSSLLYGPGLPFEHSRSRPSALAVATERLWAWMRAPISPTSQADDPRKPATSSSPR